MTKLSKDERIAMMQVHAEKSMNVVRGEPSKTSMLYWFHNIKNAGVPVPKTEFVLMLKEVREAIWKVFDGHPLEMTPPVTIFRDHLLDSAEEVGGFPIFLRTHFTSGKHDWIRTCYVEKSHKILNHVCAIAEYSECAAMFGELDWTMWAVREMLPTIPAFYAFNGMPIVCEFRVFARNGGLICHHPYWPPEAIEGRTKEPNWRVLLDDLQQGYPTDAISIALTASRAVPDFAWSVDVLKTERGWFVTDMALMHESYHWKGCLHA